MENLSYYDNVTPISYQLFRNVKDTSFTKIQIVSRDYIRSPKENSTAWGYDINTDLPYGYKRTFTQLDYSSPDDIKWLSATQTLPYAFCLKSNYRVQYGSRSTKGGFYYLNDSYFNFGDFSYKPSDEYISLQPTKIITSNSYACTEDLKLWHDISLNGSFCNNENFTPEQQKLFNEQITSVLSSLKALTNGYSIPTPIKGFDCTVENTAFEELINEYFNLSAKVTIDSSILAKDYLNNELDNLNAVKVIPQNWKS